MSHGTYFLKTLREILDQRQRSNSQYSLRAFSRDVDVHPSTLSAVLKGKRLLPLKDARKVVENLSLSPKERTLFLESLFRSKTKLDLITISEDDERFMLDESYYKVIAEWEHFAALVLFDTQKFSPTLKNFSNRLGISESRAQSVIDHLITSGLLRRDEQGVLQKTQASVRTTEDIKSQAIHEGHKDALILGQKKLDEVSVDLRDFSEMAVAVDLTKMIEAKTIIREFRQKMAALLRDGEKTEVYQLAIQFYPLTVSKEKTKKE